jgi:hypothetical protein
LDCLGKLSSEGSDLIGEPVRTLSLLEPFTTFSFDIGAKLNRPCFYLGKAGLERSEDRIGLWPSHRSGCGCIVGCISGRNTVGVGRYED